MKLLFSLAMAWALSLAVNAATVSFSGITSTNAVKTNDLLLVDSALGGTNYATRTATIATLQSALSIPTVPTGLVSNSVAQSGLLAVDATKTNGVAATFAHVTNALGYFPLTNSFAAVTNALNYLPATNGATIATAANWVASGTTNSTLAGNAVIGGSPVELGTRASVSIFSVPYLRSATTNKTTAFDVMPNGAPSESTGNGYAWIDVVDADCSKTAVDPSMNTLRLAARNADLEIGSRTYGGASAKQITFTQDSTTMMRFLNKNLIFSDQDHWLTAGKKLTIQNFYNSGSDYSSLQFSGAGKTNGISAFGAGTGATGNSIALNCDGVNAITASSSGVAAPAAQISDLLIGAMAVNRGTLTHAGGNVIMDLSLTNRYWSCTLTGNVQFVLTNCSAGKWANVLLTMPATNCTPLWPVASTGITNWFGGAPSTLTGGAIGALSFYAVDSTTNSTKAAYAETQ